MFNWYMDFVCKPLWLIPMSKETQLGIGLFWGLLLFPCLCITGLLMLALYYFS